MTGRVTWPPAPPEPIATEAAPSDRRSTTRLSLALAIALIAGAFLLVGLGCGGSDLCPGPLLGIYSGILGVILLMGLGIRAALGRSSPLLVVEVLFLIVIGTAAISTILTFELTLFGLLVVGLFVLAFAAAIRTAQEVSRHRVERLIVAVVLVGLVLLTLSRPNTIPMSAFPILVLIALFRPVGPRVTET